jgi:hypothetical protein
MYINREFVRKKGRERLLRSEWKRYVREAYILCSERRRSGKTMV